MSRKQKDSISVYHKIPEDATFNERVREGGTAVMSSRETVILNMKRKIDDHQQVTARINSRRRGEMSILTEQLCSHRALLAAESSSQRSSYPHTQCRLLSVTITGGTARRLDSFSVREDEGDQVISSACLHHPPSTTIVPLTAAAAAAAAFFAGKR